MATKQKTKKKPPKKNIIRKKRASKNSSRGKKKAVRKKGPVSRRTAPARNRSVTPGAVLPEKLEARTEELSGDLQGLSNVAEADSESVDELLEEGNAFEASVVKGVQDADNADEGEVHTHEVPENDVPEEYLDKDT